MRAATVEDVVTTPSIRPAPTAAAPREAAVRPALLVVAAAGCLSISAVLIKLAGTSAETAAFLRCALALPALLPLAVRECRKHGWAGARLLGCGVVAGIFLGIDYAMYTKSILDAGAGVATVLNNVQVLVFPLLGLVFLGTPIERRFLVACPVLLGGIALVGGVLSHDPGAAHQARGTALGLLSGAAYACYLHLSRAGGRRSPRHVITPVCAATASAALVTGAFGAATGGISLELPAMSWVWLGTLALVSQVIAFLLLSAGAPALAPGTSATLLLLQPVLAVGFGMLVVAETPTASQLVGCALVVAAVWFANRTREPGSGAVPRRAVLRS